MHTLFVREHNRLAREIAEQHPEWNGDQISSDPEVQQRLAAVYASVDDVDPWIGGLAEDDVPRAMVGPLFFAILQTQFEALRDGDRFWYQNALAPNELDAVEGTRLADIIRRNTEIADEIGSDVFRVPGSDGPTRQDPGGGRRPLGR